MLLQFASGERIVRLLPALMTSADLDHNDKLLAVVEKKEKLEWVTPRLTLMGAEDTEGNKPGLGGEQSPDTSGPS